MRTCPITIMPTVQLKRQSRTFHAVSDALRPPPRPTRCERSCFVGQKSSRRHQKLSCARHQRALRLGWSALFPTDRAVQMGIECWPNPEGRLGQQPLANRIRKRVDDYRARSSDFRDAWSRLATTLDEARRFDGD